MIKMLIFMHIGNHYDAIIITLLWGREFSLLYYFVLIQPQHVFLKINIDFIEKKKTICTINKIKNENESKLMGYRYRNATLLLNIFANLEVTQVANSCTQ